MRRWYALALAAVVWPGLAGCAHKTQRSRFARQGSPVPLAVAREATVRATTTISGVIAPFQNVAITSSLSEPADSVRVLQGDRVRAGQVLAVLDTADLRAQLAQAQGALQGDIRTAQADDARVAQTRFTARLNIDTGSNQVRSSRAALAQAQQTLANDQSNLTRDQALVRQGYISQQTVEAQQTAVLNDQAAIRTAQANLQTALTNRNVNGTSAEGLQAANVAAAVSDAQAAHAAVGQARGQIEQYQVQIDKATIVSPVDGIVVNRNLNPGEYPGSRTIFTVQQLDTVYANLNASSENTFAIPNGAPVSMTVGGASGKQYTGKVTAVLGQVTPGSTDFTVQVLIPNANDELQAGLPVTARVSLPAVRGVGIPTTSFLDDTHTSVMIAQDQLVDTVAKTIQVRELGSDGTTSVVSGLRAGTQVVSNGQLGLADGQSIDQN